MPNGLDNLDIVTALWSYDLISSVRLVRVAMGWQVLLRKSKAATTGVLYRPFFVHAKPSWTWEIVHVKGRTCTLLIIT